MQTGRRWRLLGELEDWLQTPMLLLSVVWLAIAIFELTGNSSDLLLFIGTTIWLIFIGEFLLRFSLAPEKRAFLQRNG